MRTLLKITALMTLAAMVAGTALARGPERKYAPMPTSKADNASGVVAVAPMDLPALGSRNATTLDEIVLTEGFEAYTTGQLPTGWTQVDVDGGYCTQFTRNSTWQVYTATTGITAHSGTKFVMCHYNDAALPNNDWLILPSQTLAGTITLTYWVASQDAAYPDDYQVKVSTTGTQPANFTNLIYDQNSVPITWAQKTHDLSAYAGAPFYLAFHYDAIDEFMLKIDDIVIDAGAATPSGDIEGVVTSDAAPNPPVVGATVEVIGQAATSTTDASGHYFLNNLPAGTYSLAFSHPTFESATHPGVVVVVDDTTTVNQQLHPLAITQVDIPSTAAPSPIADLDTAYLSLNVTQDLLIVDLDVTINITHTYDSDLEIWLAGPGGSMVKLTDNNGGSGDNFVNTRFDDEAATGIASGTAPFTGSFRPIEQLSAFDQFSTMGTWTLVAYDGAAADVGQITNFTLHVTAEAGGPSGSIGGTVVNHVGGTALAGVNVAIQGTALSTTTNVSGGYSFATVDPGTYTLNFTLAGFNPLSVPNVVVVDGQSTPVNVEMVDLAAGDPSVPLSFAFHGNYPNPFNATTRFSFDLASTANVSLDIYNTVGAKVATLVHGTMDAGSHTVSFDGSNLATGIYFARMTMPGQVVTSKVILLK